MIVVVNICVRISNVNQLAMNVVLEPTAVSQIIAPFVNVQRYDDECILKFNIAHTF